MVLSYLQKSDIDDNIFSSILILDNFIDRVSTNGYAQQQQQQIYIYYICTCMYNKSITKTKVFVNTIKLKLIRINM